MEPTLEVTGLSVRLESGDVAVSDIECSIWPGEVYCLLGGAGAGKTTVLRSILGLRHPTTGSVRILGRPVSANVLLARRSAALVSSEAFPVASMTARQNLRFFATVAQPEAQWDAVEVVNAMRLMGLPERAFDRRAGELPPENLLALWLAVAWLRRTPLVLVDDPTIGIDTGAAAKLEGQINRFKAHGRAVLVATHDVLFASQIADRIAILKQGIKVTECTRSEVLSLSLTELYYQYVGQPPQRVSLEHPVAPPRL